MNSLCVNATKKIFSKIFLASTGNAYVCKMMIFRRKITPFWTKFGAILGILGNCPIIDVSLNF
ncbi:MAG: hypothetical protein EA442_05490 [Candidatus Nitrosopelagicus sp.]|nr:MAG: hypothetical protein EA442_05490 [Candidatus Nitrosopelagicus sp.]